MIGVASGANANLSARDIDRLPASLFVEMGLLLIAGLEVPIDAVKAAIRRASAAGLPILLNPAPVDGDLMDLDLLNQVDVMTPNRGELATLAGIETASEEGIILAARKLPSKGVIVTLGSDGCIVLHRGEVRKIPAHVVQAIDTVGAGDAFNGALALAVAEGRSLFEAATWASAAAALSVTRPGAQSALPFRSEIDRQAGARYA